MKQLYAPTLKTCILSGMFLAILLLVPVAAYAFTSTTLFAGIASIAVGAFLINSKLSRAGLDTVGAQLSHFALFSRMALLVVAAAISFLSYVLLSISWMDHIDPFDLARIAFALVAVSFFPTFFYLVSSPFSK